MELPLTYRAKQVVQRAIQEAQSRGHEYVDTEHILLGLTTEESGVVASELKKLHIDMSKVRIEVAKALEPNRPSASTAMPKFTRKAKKAIEFSVEESQKSGDNFIGAEHLLLGLLQAREGKASQVLMKLLLENGDVRRGVLQMFVKSAPESSASEQWKFWRAMIGIWPFRHNKLGQSVMGLANEEARRLNHEYIGAEHVLLGLIREGSNSNLAAKILRRHDIDLKSARLELQKLIAVGSGDMISRGKLPFTPQAKKVIEYAIEEARRLEHQGIDAGHLLLGLIREREGIADQILLNLGINLDDLREEIIGELGR